MKDNLKSVVEERREEFEIYQTDFDGLWHEINKETGKIRTLHVLGTIWRVAAIVVVAIGIGWWAVQAQFIEKSGYSLSDLSPELAETEYYYSQMVAEKLNMIKSSNADIDDEVMHNLAALDSAYQDLKNDLKDNADNEEVVSAMINNYRIKLDILEQILREIKDHDDDHESDEVNI